MALNPKPYRRYKKLSKRAWTKENEYEVTDVNAFQARKPLDSWYHLTIRRMGKQGPRHVLASFGLENDHQRRGLHCGYPRCSQTPMYFVSGRDVRMCEMHADITDEDGEFKVPIEQAP